MNTFLDETLRSFKKLTKRYAAFHLIFFTLFFLQLIALILFMPFFAKTLSVAIGVATTFLTVFLYFVLRFYLQIRKPEELSSLRDQFLGNITITSSWSPEPLYPIYQLIHKLQAPKHTTFKPFAPLAEKFTLWCHWDSMQWMQEELHLHAIRTLLNWVKLYPLDLELHRTLAGAYTALYQIYLLPQNAHPLLERKRPFLQPLFEKAAVAAVEELKIILHSLPEDTWALTQLARVYHSLRRPDEERATYEMLHRLHPDDPDIHYALGRLYFSLGLPSHALPLYNALLQEGHPLAEQLIACYAISSRTTGETHGQR